MPNLEQALEMLKVHIMAQPEPVNHLATTETQPPEPATSERALLPSVPPPEPLTWDQLPLKESPTAQDELTRLLYQAFASQKAFGDKAQMMEYRDGMFQVILADFPFLRIREAFIEHIRRKPDLPTPSDVYNILDPVPEPLSTAYYIQLKEKDYYSRSQEERGYITLFEAEQINKARKHPSFKEQPASTGMGYYRP